jgi:hypothetical protein
MTQIDQGKESNGIRVVILDRYGHIVSRKKVQEEIPLLVLTMLKDKDRVVLVPRKWNQIPQRVTITGKLMGTSNICVRSFLKAKGKKIVKPIFQKAGSTDAQAQVEYRDGLPLIHTQVPDDLVDSLRDLRDQ